GPGDESRCGENRSAGNPAGSEPVFLLTFIENDLEGSDAEGNQGEAGVIDVRFCVTDALLLPLQIWRIFDQPMSEKQRQNADRDVDEEDPVPAIVIGNPASYSGANGWRDHDRHAINGEAEPTLGGRE